MKYLKFPVLAFAAVACLVSCDDDRDDNPVIDTTNADVEFILNTPAYVNTEISLTESDSLNFTWSQPAWGFPMVVNYNIQLSKDGSFTTSYAEQTADESGATVADYYQFDVTNQCASNVAAKDICRAIASLSSWSSEGDVPETQEVYLRVKAQPSTKTAIESLIIYSDTIKLTTRPYYIALKDADPEMWYLIGACIGDGAWTNTPEGLGTSTFPMSIIDGAKYNSNTGKGTLTFTGYFTTDGFKVIRQLGDWTDQWGMNDGEFVFQDGGSGNIVVAENGFYTITLDNVENKISMAAYEGNAPAVYSGDAGVAVSGDFNDWADTPMTPFNTAENVENHLWTYELSTEVATTLKFKINGDTGWSPNWGGTGFPYGVGVSNGANIPVPAGNWTVTFNDVDGSYAFTSK